MTLCYNCMFFLNGGSTSVTQATNRGLMNSKNRKKSDPYLSTAVAKLGIWALGVTSSRCFGREDESLLAATASTQDDAFRR